MYKHEDNRYINAGENEVYRYGRKAQELVKSYLTPNEAGFYSIPADGGKYYTIGTSTGRYGEFARVAGGFLSVNKAGNVWAKVGTDKADVFVKMINDMIDKMVELNNARVEEEE